jgi:hypothetical protein
MTTGTCSCGFTELDDETLTDHLHLVFEPDDRIGTDGQAHGEGDPLTCACGFTAATVGELDEHLLKAFTPDDAVGRDGQRHEVVDRA